MKQKQKHIAVCPKACVKDHEFCTMPCCAKVGEHFASDHYKWKTCRVCRWTKHTNAHVCECGGVLK